MDALTFTMQEGNDDEDSRREREREENISVYLRCSSRSVPYTSQVYVVSSRGGFKWKSLGTGVTVHYGTNGWRNFCSKEELRRDAGQYISEGAANFVCKVQCQAAPEKEKAALGDQADGPRDRRTLGEILWERRESADVTILCIDGSRNGNEEGGGGGDGGDENGAGGGGAGGGGAGGAGADAGGAGAGSGGVGLSASGSGPRVSVHVTEWIKAEPGTSSMSSPSYCPASPSYRPVSPGIFAPGSPSYQPPPKKKKNVKSNAFVLESFRCHRVVLCARSDVFRAMFSQARTAAVVEEIEREVRIRDLSPRTVKDMLQFMYTDR